MRLDPTRGRIEREDGRLVFVTRKGRRMAIGPEVHGAAELLGLPEGDVSRFRTWAMIGGDILAGNVDATRLGSVAEEAIRMFECLGEHLDRVSADLRHDEHAPLLHPLAAAVKEDRVSRDTASSCSGGSSPMPCCRPLRAFASSGRDRATGRWCRCPTPTAIAWDAAFQGHADPSGRAVRGVHKESY